MDRHSPAAHSFHRPLSESESGQGTAEYLAIAILVAIIVLISVRIYGQSIACYFSGAADQVKRSKSGAVISGCGSGEELAAVDGDDSPWPPVKPPPKPPAKPPVRPSINPPLPAPPAGGGAGANPAPPITSITSTVAFTTSIAPATSIATTSAPTTSVLPVPTTISTIITTIPAITSSASTTVLSTITTTAQPSCYVNYTGGQCKWNWWKGSKDICNQGGTVNLDRTCGPLYPVQEKVLGMDGSLELYCNSITDQNKCNAAKPPPASMLTDPSDCGGKCK